MRSGGPDGARRPRTSALTGNYRQHPERVMTDAEYKALRSQARHAARVANIRFETSPSAEQIESDRRWAARLAALVPGGLTTPFIYGGCFGLLPEWHARRNAVR